MFNRRRLQRMERKIDLLLQLQGQLQKGQATAMLDLSTLTDAVAAIETVDESVETLLSSLTAEIQTLIDQNANTVDPAQLQSLVDRLNNARGQHAAAVVANTPAASAAQPAAGQQPSATNTADSPVDPPPAG